MFSVIGCVKVAPGVVTQSPVLHVPLSQAQLLIATVTPRSWRGVSAASLTRSPRSVSW
ncbi:hypothetical protein D9M68_985200 [compost metagenome]